MIRNRLWVVFCLAAACCLPHVVNPYAEEAAARKSSPIRRLLVNNDGTNLLWRDDLSMDMVKRHAAECPNAVTTYLVCPNGIQKMMYPSKHEALSTRGALPALVAEGKDPFGAFLAELKTRGFETFITFRMNEVHNVDKPEEPDLCALWREHPEYRVERGEKPSDWMSQCLDYALAPVREHALALITELMETYQPDGIELDWMRFPRHLRGQGEEIWAQRAFLTEVVAQVRAKATELSQATGKPMLVAVRVPSSLAGCHALGADIVEWNRQHLIDFVTAAPFLSSDFSMPLREMKQALAEHPIPVYGGIEFGFNGGPHSEETLRSAAFGLYDSGADGIYLFNFPCWRETMPHPFWSWVPPLRDISLLRGKRLTFPLIGQSHRVAGIDLPPQLPVEVPANGTATLSFAVPKLALSKGQAPYTATLILEPQQYVNVKFNGRPLDTELDVPLELLQPGENQIELACHHAQAVSVNRIELHLAYPPLTALPAPNTAKAIYVSPEGSDDNPGTETAPVKSLEKARNLLRAQRGGTALLRGGTYRLQKPLTLTAKDNNTAYRAFAGESPVLSGGVLITGWREDANGRWKAEANLKDFRQLYVNRSRAIRARGACPDGIERYGENAFFDEDAGFLFPDGAMAAWQHAERMELGFYNSWSHMICRVERITRDAQGRAVMKMRQPWFHLASRKEGVQAVLPAYVENALELLDEPGEWYFDQGAHTIYYRPRPGEDLESAEVVAPQLETLLRVDGTEGRPARGVSFEGITFADATWLRPNRIGHPDTQANCCIQDTNLFTRDNVLVSLHNEYLKSPANVVLHTAENCRFERCVFTRLGGAGLDIEQGSRNNLVHSCQFFDISGSGIQVGDVRRIDHHPPYLGLIVRNNQILNCSIHDAGVEFQDSVGIFGGYVDGTVMAHNLIYDLPYSGISLGWGWGEEDAGGGAYENIPYRYLTPTPCGANRIEGNHIHHVMLKRNDGGGVYMLGNQPGTIIRDNHIHDNGPDGPGGIYLDEGSGFIEITGNCVYNVPTAMNYNNRAQNRIETCFEHDNFFDVTPDDPKFPEEIVIRAGPPGSFLRARM